MQSVSEIIKSECQKEVERLEVSIITAIMANICDTDKDRFLELWKEIKAKPMSKYPIHAKMKQLLINNGLEIQVSVNKEKNIGGWMPKRQTLMKNKVFVCEL